MKRPRHVGSVLTIFLLSATLARAELSDEIRGVLNDKLLSRADVGVYVIRLGNDEHKPRTVFEYKALTPRVPASNLKLVTTATAMEKLGADFQFKTTLAARDRDLAMIGDGDPTLGDAEMLRKVGWDVD